MRSALGGRYDEVGKAFGRARPATGFSMDLRELAALAPDGRRARARAGAVRAAATRRCSSAIAALRARGTPVDRRAARARAATRGELELRPQARASASRQDGAHRRKLRSTAATYGKNVVVVGTQWGDEGKGKIVDWLTDHAQGVVRFQGGHNAGHTLVIGGPQDRAASDSVRASCARRSPATSATASCSRRRRCSRKSTCSKPPASTSRSRLKISEACPLILPHHAALDQAREAAKGDRQDRHDRPRHRARLRRQGRAPRDPAAGPLSPRALRGEAGRSARLPQLHAEELFQAPTRSIFTRRSTRRWRSPSACKPMVADVPRLLYEAQQAGEQPAVRRRAGHAARRRSRHLSVRDLEQLRGRRGGGGRGRRPDRPALRARASPRPIPRAWARARFRPSSRTTSAGSLQAAATSSARRPGGARRCGWFDAAALKRSIQINGVSGLCVTKLDVLDGMEAGAARHRLSLPAACRATSCPSAPKMLAECEPVYEDDAGLEREHGRRRRASTSCRRRRRTI